MDYRYKSSFYHDLDGHREFTRSFNDAYPLHWAIYLIYSIFILWWMDSFDEGYYVYRFLLISVVVLIISLINRSKKGDLQYRRLLQNHGGKPIRQDLYFSEDGVRVIHTPNGNQLEFNYDQFRYVIESKHLLILVLKYRSCLILNKVTLTGGNIDSFFAFLKEHCPKLKGKKPRSVTVGKWLRRVFTVILTVGSIWALMNLPFFSVTERMFDKLHNDISYREMAEELSEMGIDICNRTILEMEEYDADYLQKNGFDFYDGAYRYQKVADLLYWEGSGIYEDFKGWDPSNSGIYWVGYFPEEISVCYNEFFDGLNAMNASLVFSNIQEDLSRLDETGVGPGSLIFEYQGERHSIRIDYNQYGFDDTVINKIGRIIDSDAEHLYVCHRQNDGALLYYGTPKEIRLINRRTSLDFKKASGIFH